MWSIRQWHACKNERLVSPRSQPGGWKCIPRGLLPLVKWRQSLQEWIPRVRAKLIALVPFGYEAYSICILAFFVAPQGS